MTALAVPILMYHKVGAPVQTKSDTFLNVSVRDFDRQTRLLGRMRYTGITLADAADGLAGWRSLPRKPVCITFDDGYVNVAENAAPILSELGWPATVFVPTAYVGRENEWDRPNGHPILPIMDWRRLRELSNQGWEMSGHTRTHPHLNQLSREASLDEMRGGKADLESNVRMVVRTFCYPYGSLPDDGPDLCRKAGFIAACTTRSGVATARTDPYLLPRVKIAYRDGVLGLLYRLLIRPRLP